jgi:hypothetical protein
MPDDSHGGDEMSYTIYYFSRFTIINTYGASIKESEPEI